MEKPTIEKSIILLEEIRKLLIANYNDRPNAVASFGTAKLNSRDVKEIFDKQFKFLAEKHNALASGTAAEIEKHKSDVSDELDAMQKALDAELEKHKDATAAEIAAHKAEVDRVLETQDEEIDGAVSSATEAVRIADELKARADAGEFKGDQGDKGDRGEKGDPGLIQFIFVAELPTEDIDESALYLVPSPSPSEDNKFVEYFYANGRWEMLPGSINVDLTDYVRNTDVATAAGGSNPTSGKLGLTRYVAAYYGGLTIDKNGCVKVNNSSNPKSERGSYSCQPITAENLNDFLIEALAGDTYQLALTDEQKAAVLKLLGVDDTVAAHETAINEALSAQDEVIGGAVDQAAAAQQNAQEALNTANELKADPIPDYWQTHLDKKIATIKALQGEGGKDCFSFVVMTDMHYPSNLGKRSPTIAKRILDKCDIKYALCLGDTQTRGCYQTKEEILLENEQVKEMFAPIKDRLLQIEGNHDGSYYWSGGVVGSGTSYVKQLTEQEMFEEYYRTNGLNGDVHFDKNSNAFYVDDVSNKVRYIGLNSMNVPNSKTDINTDGTAQYTKFRNYQFLQAQYDFLCNEALVTVPSDEWSVVVFGHSGIYNDGDYAVMVDVLSAYKDKTNCVAEYAGTAEGGAAYTNLAEPLPDNTTDTSKWVNGYRISSTALTTSSGEGKTTCNPIPCTTGDVIRIKGVSFVASVDRAGAFTDETTVGTAQYVSSLPNSEIGYFLDGDVHTFTILGANVAYKYFRCAFSTPTNPENIIITKNEEIVESARGYDYVSVNHDFTDAKGNFVAYFHGHEHQDMDYTRDSIKDIATRCDAREEYEETDQAERVEGTTTEQSFDVFTVNKAKRKIYATKIGAGTDREIGY